MAKERAKPLSFVGILVSTLLIASIFSFGTTATWSALVKWLPTEEVSIQITDTESRTSYRIKGGSSPNYWIKVVDENGLSQNISCNRETYAALTPVGLSGENLKLLRNPLLKTPVAFLRSNRSILNIDPDSALGKILAAGEEKTAPIEPERFYVIKYPVVFIVLGIVFLGGAVWMFTKILKIAKNRTLAIAANLLCSGAAATFGIYWCSGLL